MESAAGELAQRRHHQLPGRHTRRCRLGRLEQRYRQRQHAHPSANEPHVWCPVQGHDRSRDQGRFRPVHRSHPTAH